nr:winged helix-turn-helix domain-containing protein [Virgisporangium aliadipatigenens]
MTDADGLAALAAIFADPTRAAFCLALMDGRAWTAGELARHAGVAGPTATGHLHRMVDAGVLVEHRQGRHRYVRLAGPQVAQLVETLHAHRPAGPPARTLRAVTARAALEAARTCYDHLAGRLGVAVTDALTTTGLLDQDNGFAVTPAGLRWFDREMGVELVGRRPVARSCIDWTERRVHLGGAAGAALCATFLERRWVTRVGTGRALRVTDDGKTALRNLLGVEGLTNAA